MKFTTSSVPLLTLLPGAALGAALEKRADLECNTVYGHALNKAKVPTAIHTVRAVRTVEATVTRHGTVTITPTVTRHRLPVTITDTVTITRTGSTRTITGSSGSGTSTVATPSHFTPANSASGLQAAASANANAKRSVTVGKKNSGHVAVKVDCTARVHYRTETKTKTRFIRPYRTSTRREAVTVRTGKASTTHTTATDVNTVHPTHTIHPGAVTVYAACAADNLLGWTIGQGSSNSTSNSTAIQGGNGTSSGHVGINSVVLLSGTKAKTSQTLSAYRCCVECQETTGCIGSTWRFGVCNMHVVPNAKPHSCPSTEVVGSFYADSKRAVSPGNGLIISNGFCGTWKYGGMSG